MEQLTKKFKASMRGLADNPSQERAYGRFLNNDSVTEEILIEEATSRCSGLCPGRKHVLNVQDTSEANLRNQRHRLKIGKGNIGRLDSPSDKNIGFKMHLAISFDALTLAPLGYSYIDLWHRPLDMPTRHKRDYNKLPIEQKESYKWIEAATGSKDVLKEAECITFIEDMEGDIFEQFLRVPDEKTHLLIRSHYKRMTTEKKSIKVLLDAAPVATTYTIELPAEHRKNRKKRTATLQVRFITCTLVGPVGNEATKGKNVKINVVEAREIDYSGKDAINLRLLTTHAVQSTQQALQIIDWYRCRWYVEQVFRLLKNEGFKLENCELEEGDAIRKLCVMMLTSLLKVVQSASGGSLP